MTTLEEEPMERQPAETLLPEQPTRLLGNVALQGEPQDLCDSILQHAVETDVQTPQDFSTLLHTSLVAKVQAVNRRHHRTSNTSVIDQKRVQDALADYYLLFPEANAVQDNPPTNQAHRHYLTTHAQNAQSNMYTYPEINLLLRLETDFREQAGEAVANAAVGLLAAYGWAIRADYGATRIDLFRAAGKTHLLANKRKQR